MSDSWLIVFALPLGLCVGSFLNVCIWRLPAGQSIRNPPRSLCPRCGMPIRARDNLPVIGYLLLGARCRDCHGPIHWRYPVVELLGGLLAVGIALRYGPTGQALASMALASALVVAAFIDIDHRIIPDRITLPGIPLGWLAAVTLTPLTGMDSLLGALTGAGILAVVSWGYRQATGRDGMGSGDVKLMGLIGTLVGWPGAVFTIITGAAAGLLGGLAAMVRSGRGMRTAIPFGPFLAIGALIYLLAGPELIALYLRRMG